MGNWAWQCTTTDLYNSTKLRMEKIRQAVTEIWVPQFWQPPEPWRQYPSSLKDWGVKSFHLIKCIWKCLRMNAILFGPQQIIWTGWHIYASVIYISIGSDNGSSHKRCQEFIWTNAGILSIGPLGRNANKVVTKYNHFRWKSSLCCLSCHHIFDHLECSSFC